MTHALLAGLISIGLAAKAAHAPVLPFIENDFDAAVAKAKETKKPIFIEVWAPW